MAHVCYDSGVFFIFIFFKKQFYRNIFLVLNFTVLYPYRPAGGRQGAYRPAGGGRDLYVNKNNFFYAEVLGGSLPPPCRAAAGGGRLPPQI